MIVSEVIKALEKQNPNAEVYMFIKSADCKMEFTSNITNVSEGAVRDEYGELQSGVLISKNIK